jgi:hypothetical protein
VYRFLHNTSVCWERPLQRIALSVIPQVSRLTSDERRTAIVIDDSPVHRDRSKKVELLSKYYDHVTGRFYKGFTLLAAVWTDGETTIPVDYRMVASGNEDKLIEGPHAGGVGKTTAAWRRKSARTEKPALVLQMLSSLKGTAAQAKHVLFDSRFTCPSSLLDIKALGYDVVARMKNAHTHYYRYKGQPLPISEIYGMNRKRRGRAKYLLSVEVEVALACRENNDQRSVCELFYAMCNEVDDISFAQAFGSMMEMFAQLLADHLHLPEEKLGEAVNHFISGLPAWIKRKLPLSMCES